MCLRVLRGSFDKPFPFQFTVTPEIDDHADSQTSGFQVIENLRLFISLYTLPIHESKMGVKLGDTFLGMCTLINLLDWR